MSKEALKIILAEQQGGVCAYSGEPLDLEDASLFDPDRQVPKADGGIYDPDNTRAVTPRAHMERHGILRVRVATLEDVKSVFDDRVQAMKLMLKLNNQLLAYKRRTDHLRPESLAWLEQQMIPVQARLDEIDKLLAYLVKHYPDPLVTAALGVPSLGPVTIAALLFYVDATGIYTEDDRAVKLGHKRAGTEKAPNPSSLWAYCGLDKPSHERYTKGEAGGGNKTLRTVLWNTAVSMMKNRNCAYRDVYDRTKLRLSISEKITKSRNTQGKLIECAWKDTKPSHRHGAALRAMVKHVLSDYWYVARELRGMSTRPVYAEGMLGHSHILNPRDRGWEWEAPNKG